MRVVAFACRLLAISTLFLAFQSASTQAACQQVVSQKAIGINGCGPCSIVNSLLSAKNAKVLDTLAGASGLEKVRSVIEKYGSGKSKAYDGQRTIYSDDNGVADIDLRVLLNQILNDSGEASASGMYLLRAEGQSEIAFVSDVHATIKKSVELGFHPLLSVRALSAEFNESQDRFLFNSKGGHWVAIDGVSEVSQDGLSFSIEFSDSISGKSQTGFVFLNQHRNASVPMSFSVNENGEEQWSWASNKRTLEIISPAMPLGTSRAKFHERALIALRYLIFRDPQIDTDVPSSSAEANAVGQNPWVKSGLGAIDRSFATKKEFANMPSLRTLDAQGRLALGVLTPFKPQDIIQTLLTKSGEGILVRD